jgi:hypothetical protein
MVRLQVESIKPDLTQYKIHDINFVPPADQPIFVEFMVDDDQVEISEGQVVFDLNGLFHLAGIITVESLVVETQYSKDKQKKLRDALT